MSEALVEVVDCSSTVDAPKAPPSSAASERIRDFLKSHLTTDSNNDATTDDDSQREAAGSPPPNCAICLGRVTSKCFTDSCMHQFCFSCLLEWSKIKAECPLCKQTFKSIIHNVVSMDKYEEYKVEHRRFANFRNIADSLELILRQRDGFSQVSSHRSSNHPHSIYYANLLAFDRPDRPLARHILPNSTSTSSSTGASNLNRFFQLFLNESELTERFARQYANDIIPSRASGASWRAYVYQRRLYAMPLLDVNGRSRDISASFYTENAAQVHRLMPWLNREVLFLMNSFMPISYIMGMMTNNITTYDITSPEFRREILPYFHSYTDHFIHELANFARSPFDMIGYDMHAQYRPTSAPEPVPVSDIELSYERSQDGAITVASASVIVQPTPSTSGFSVTPFIFRPTTQSTPINLTSVTIDSEDSDDEVVFVREQKPPHLRTPVMIELNSDSDSDVQFVTEDIPIKLEGDPNCVHPSTNSEQLTGGYSSEEELNVLAASNVTITTRVKNGARPSASATTTTTTQSTTRSPDDGDDDDEDEDDDDVAAVSTSSSNTNSSDDDAIIPVTDDSSHAAISPLPPPLPRMDDADAATTSNGVVGSSTFPPPAKCRHRRISSCSTISDSFSKTQDSDSLFGSTSSDEDSPADMMLAADVPLVNACQRNVSTSSSTSSSSDNQPVAELFRVGKRKRFTKKTTTQRATGTASINKLRQICSTTRAIAQSKRAKLDLGDSDTCSDSSD